MTRSVPSESRRRAGESATRRDRNRVNVALHRLAGESHLGGSADEDRGERIDFDPIPCSAELIPCYREIAFLLSRIDSLFRCAGNFISHISQITEFADVFGTDLRKRTAESEKIPC
jgi:hypothetical protein